MVVAFSLPIDSLRARRLNRNAATFFFPHFSRADGTTKERRRRCEMKRGLRVKLKKIAQVNWLFSGFSLFPPPPRVRGEELCKQAPSLLYLYTHRTRQRAEEGKFSMFSEKKKNRKKKKNLQGFAQSSSSSLSAAQIELRDRGADTHKKGKKKCKKKKRLNLNDFRSHVSHN